MNIIIVQLLIWKVEIDLYEIERILETKRFFQVMDGDSDIDTYILIINDK